MTTRIYTVAEVTALLIERQGSRTQKDLAEEMGVSAQYLSDVLSGRRGPGQSILAYLGLEVGYFKSERAA